MAILMPTTKHGICSLEQIPVISLFKTGWEITHKSLSMSLSRSPTRAVKYQQGAGVSATYPNTTDEDMAHCSDPFRCEWKLPLRSRITCRHCRQPKLQNFLYSSNTTSWRLVRRANNNNIWHTSSHGNGE